jgi:hypothetical protein
MFTKPASCFIRQYIPVQRAFRYHHSIITPSARLFTTSPFKMSPSSFDRLIRFQTADGKTIYGNLAQEVPTREIEGRDVEVLEGDLKSGFKKSGDKAKVQKLLCPLKREELNIIPCVGLNYKHHAEEGNVSGSGRTEQIDLN